MSRKQETAQGQATDERRRLNRFWKVLLWPIVVVLAAFPSPWWW